MIGSGFISNFQARALQQVPGWTIDGLLRRSGTEDLAAYIRRNDLGAAGIYDSLGEMARDMDVLAIYSPNYTRVEIMEEIARAVVEGAELKGLICEKPLGRTLAEAARLVELAEEIEVPTAYFENQIFMKALQVQKEQLAPVEESMGPLTLIRSSEEHAGPHENWFWDPVLQGGGVLNDMGCHSIAVGHYFLTPSNRPLDFLQPHSVHAEVGLLKWGQPRWRNDLKEKRGLDYEAHPAEDFATGVVTYRNPDTSQLVKAQFTNSWMFEKQGLRILVDGIGAGYAFEVNTLISPLTVFVGDEAARAIKDQETALEKATASRGLLSVQYNEPDLYGYTDENRDALEAFQAGRDAKLPWRFGLGITRLVLAAYLSAEKGSRIDLEDPAIQKELEDYVPAIARGEGAPQLYQ